MRVTVDRYCEMTGRTEYAVRYYINKGVWTEGAARRQGRCLIFRDVSHISALSRGRITRRRASPAA